MSGKKSKQGGNLRLKILLIVLGVVAVGAFATIYFLGPLGEARTRIFSICGYDISLSASPSEVKADGTSQSVITATVSSKTIRRNRTRISPTSGILVNFSTNLGQLSATQVTTDRMGRAKTYLSSSAAGLATIRMQVTSFCSKSANVQFVNPAPPLFSDNFSGDLSRWITAWDGYGTIRIENNSLMTSPKAATSPSETHSALMRAGDSVWGNYTYNLKMNTAEQLRIGTAPNNWEVGWVTFRHQDNSRFYYFVLKPNGIELGKALGNDQQAFFVTESSPKLQLNQWNNYKIVLQGANIKVYIDGALVANYTDMNNPFLTGGIGLYNEDAKVYYDDVVVTGN